MIEVQVIEPTLYRHSFKLLKAIHNNFNFDLTTLAPAHDILQHLNFQNGSMHIKVGHFRLVNC